MHASVSVTLSRRQLVSWAVHQLRLSRAAAAVAAAAGLTLDQRRRRQQQCRYRRIVSRGSDAVHAADHSAQRQQPRSSSSGSSSSAMHATECSAQHQQQRQQQQQCHARNGMFSSTSAATRQQQRGPTFSTSSGCFSMPTTLPAAQGAALSWANDACTYDVLRRSPGGSDALHGLTLACVPNHHAYCRGKVATACRPGWCGSLLLSMLLKAMCPQATAAEGQRRSGWQGLQQQGAAAAAATGSRSGGSNRQVSMHTHLTPHPARAPLQ